MGFIAGVNKYPNASQFVVAFDNSQTCYPLGNYQQLNILMGLLGPIQFQSHHWGAEKIVCNGPEHHL